MEYAHNTHTNGKSTESFAIFFKIIEIQSAKYLSESITATRPAYVTRHIISQSNPEHDYVNVACVLE